MNSKENGKKTRKKQTKSQSCHEKKTELKLRENKLVCTPEHCSDYINQDLLLCTKCLRAVHFDCSQLPAYQISVFVSQDHEAQYTCITCVKESLDISMLAGDIKGKGFDQKLDNKKLEEKIGNLEKELKTLQAELKSSTETQVTKQNEILRLEKEVKACEGILRNENAKKLSCSKKLTT